MYFQDVILTLQNFWAKRGCIIHQPYDMEKGAGTFHPATFLRVLGPEPWRAAYVEPSRRPADGRYGENPNRLQHYYQFQVILKPSPDDIQDIYLDSLRELGIETCPVAGERRDVEIHAVARRVGVTGVDEAPDQADHLRDVVGRFRIQRGALDADRVDILQERARITAAISSYRPLLELGEVPPGILEHIHQAQCLVHPPIGIDANLAHQCNGMVIPDGVRPDPDLTHVAPPVSSRWWVRADQAY